eukprot:COSAG01_NODE_58149_length_307_cov_12.028846_1_plen_37_part_01
MHGLVPAVLPLSTQDTDSLPCRGEVPVEAVSASIPVE